MRSLALPELSLRKDIVCSTLSSWHLGVAKARPTSGVEDGFVSMESETIIEEAWPWSPAHIHV